MLGSPIAHSLSPLLHRTAYDVLGLDWHYDAVEVTEDGLEAFLSGLDAPWRGLSLTMPLKRAVLPLLDEVDERVREAGAANTVLRDADGRLHGHNTDVSGVVAAVRAHHDGPVQRVVVVGGGATAASAILGLADLGCREVTLLVRDASRAAETLAAAARHASAPTVTVADLGVAVGESDVLVSTVPASAQAAVLPAVERARVVFDVVYDPWPTPLSRAASEAGATFVSGLDLLVHQAVDQVRLMTGREDVPLAAMRAAGERALAARPGDIHSR